MKCNLTECDRGAPVAVIFLEQPLTALLHLERVLDAARHDRDVVRGVAASRVLPVDHGRRRVGSEQDVLAEQVAVQKHAGPGGRQVRLGPGAGAADLGAVQSVENAQCCERLRDGGCTPSA